jgi:hypothetical protein
MIRKLFFLGFFCLFFAQLQAQQTYQTALGLRLNGGAGISVKHFLNDKAALEGILYTRWRGLNITGLYSVHYPVFREPGFRVYFGAGAHVGFWNGRYNPWFDDGDRDSHAVVGIDGQLGLEYTFKDIPLNLSLDWKPAINIIGYTGFWGSDAALSVRYCWK